MKAKILNILLCGAVLAGCSAPVEKPKITNSRIFPAHFDKIWISTVQTFAEQSLPVSSLEKESGFITTTSHVIDTSIFGERTLKGIAVTPNIALSLWEFPKYSVNALVAKEGENQTRVTINTHIEAYERNITGAWYTCYSNGTIEKHILNKIGSKIGSSGPNAPVSKAQGYRGSIDPATGKPILKPIYEEKKNSK